MWIYDSVVGRHTDMAGKTQVRVLFKNCTNEQSVFFKFGSNPSLAEIQQAASNYMDGVLNREPVLVVDDVVLEYERQLAVKDQIIADQQLQLESKDVLLLQQDIALKELQSKVALELDVL